MTTHVVLGSTGVAGRETVAALQRRSLAVRTVSRGAAAAGPAPTVAAGHEHVSADLLDEASTARALRGADVAYLTVGLPYTSKGWARDWPPVVRNVIAACLANRTQLVFLDNVYAYGRVDGPMTETTPIRPSSRKGEVRAGLLRLLDDARGRGLPVTIGRSADFYGPGAATSAFNSFAIDRAAAGKPPMWLFDARYPHSLTYTPDLGEGLAVLGTEERATGGVWHLPTARALTGAEYLALLSGGTARPRVMSAGTMRIGAVFSSAARESLEMAYQYQAPYEFDSSAFEETFGVMPTPYADGVAAALAMATAARHEQHDPTLAR
jgi:nucleoside-diphosphate-sugar epimerase